jgi:uncharacterized protein (DUF433 family)
LERKLEVVMKLFTVPPDLPLVFDEVGVARIKGTRVTLDSVITAFRLGATPEEAVLQYPTLDLADVYAVIAFYLRETETVDSYLAEHEARRAEVRRENEQRWSPAGVRERMLARKIEAA